jgi:O-antigen/teichoic acid export membrane protein
MRSVRLTRDGATVFGAIVGANALTYVFYASVTRALGVSDAGAVLAFVAATLLVALPATVFGNAITKVVTDHRSNGDAEGAAAIAFAMERVALAGALVCFGGAFALRPAFSGTFAIAPGAVAAAATALACAFALPTPRAILQGSVAFKFYALSQLADGGTKALLGLYLLAYGGSVTLALQGYAASGVVSVAVAMLLVRAVLGRATASARVGPAPLLMARRSIPIAALTGMTFADGIVARLVLTPHDAGWYNAVALAGRALLTIVAFVPVVALPAAAARAGARSDVRRLVVAALGVAAAIILAALAVFFAVPGAVVAVIGGPAFAGAAPLLFPYGLAMGALGLAIILATILVGLADEVASLPLALIFALEIAFELRSGTAADLVRVVLAGHALAFVTCAVIVFARVRSQTRG